MCAVETTLIILLANIMGLPTHQLAKDDLCMVRASLDTTNRIAEKTRDEMLSRMCKLVAVLGNRAASAVESAEADIGTSALRKRPHVADHRGELT